MQEIFNELANTIGGGILSATGKIGRMVSCVHCDVKELEDRYEVSANVAGYKKEEVSVKMDKNVLTISAEHKEEEKKEEAGVTYLLKESSSKFSRSFSLAGAIEDGVKAKMEDGILLVTVPIEKPEEPPKPEMKTVPIQ